MDVPLYSLQQGNPRGNLFGGDGGKHLMVEQCSDHAKTRDVSRRMMVVFARPVLSNRRCAFFVHGG